mgnify:CR=1 FL=1
MNLKEKPGFIITEIVINLKGNFTADEIFLSLKEKMKNMFPSESDMKSYIRKKLETLCEYGLIGKTSFYYVSI